MGVSCLSVSSRCDAATDHGDLCVWSCEVWPAPATSLCPSSLPPLQPSPPGHCTGPSKETWTTHVGTSKTEHNILLWEKCVPFDFLLLLFLMYFIVYTWEHYTLNRSNYTFIYKKFSGHFRSSITQYTTSNGTSFKSYSQCQEQHKGR